MSALAVAASAEWLKIRKAKIFIISIAAMCVLPLVCGLFLIILTHPEFAASSLLAQKAQIAGATDWSSYFSLLNQMMSIGGIIIFGFLAAWIFGREYSDRTVKDLLALPFPRSRLVSAKLLALAAWCLLLTAISLVVAVVLGLIIGPAGFSTNVLLSGGMVFAVSAALNILLATPVAFVASSGRGYLPPIGFIIFTILFGQVAEIIGIGAYFPWDLPAIYAGAAHDSVSTIGYILFMALVALGAGATYAWWRYADQK